MEKEKINKLKEKREINYAYKILKSRKQKQSSNIFSHPTLSLPLPISPFYCMSLLSISVWTVSHFWFLSEPLKSHSLVFCFFLFSFFALGIEKESPTLETTEEIHPPASSVRCTQKKLRLSLRTRFEYFMSTHGMLLQKFFTFFPFISENYWISLLHGSGLLFDLFGSDAGCSSAG